ncbi:Atu4866 domain-containing protein [Streptomyces sp. NPDC091377]|uniref:Atu4866 domain-containing protein n=1 Tax=Streptomyces sp. NPDC091377 TaxID=3365995 RepID=UPI003828E8A6
MSSSHDSALDAILADDGRPVLFTRARILTMDPLIGTMSGADLLVLGAVVVGVGPGIVTAAGDDNAIVVDCAGLIIAPAVVDTVALAGGRAHRSEHVATLAPGNAADFLVVPDELAADVPSATAVLLTRPERVRALVAGGRPVLWDGVDVPGRGSVPGADVPGRAGVPGAGVPEVGVPEVGGPVGSPRLGVWVDRSGFLHQELTADGRYDETRGGRPHAYQGRYWIDGDRIDYLDDLGFWAYGEFRGDELHHAGYVMKLG